ncbi:MAG: hypothetical protein HY908_30040 [Myxococcales bacterium]|nr:hypothetical protein [Myxococcales bacterium]
MVRQACGKGKRRLGAALRGIALGGLVVGMSASCEEFDATRRALPKNTLGDDIYGAICDRLGASSFSEDLTGSSYRAICHYDENGAYGSVVDLGYLPAPPDAVAGLARSRSIAKLELMAKLRPDIVKALNAAFPDIVVPDATQPGQMIRLHDALLDFTQRLTLLYEDNPYVPGGEAVMPAQTRALGRLFEALSGSEPARQALSRINARRGYRPFQVALGAIRSMLSYPGLRAFTRASMQVLGPAGTAVPQLQQFLTTVKAELLTAIPNVAPLGPYLVEPATVQPNRPRSPIEVTAAILLDRDDAYASPSAPPRYVAVRDRRGFVVPLGSSPGVPGTLPAPFVDLDNDGFADVDGFGRFVDAAAQPLAIDPPFYLPGITMAGGIDPFQRLAEPTYEYVDTTRTLLGALTRDMLPLLDAGQYAGQGDPEPWMSEHETLMYALAGTHILAGRREPAQYDYANEQILPAGAPCQGCLPYTRFRGEESPFADVVHAAGQILADPDSDTLLLGLIDLLENHEQTLARVMGALLRVDEIAEQHDALAAQGQEPRAELAYEVPIWDQMAQVLGRMSDEPELVRKIVDSLADPVIVQSHSQDPIIGSDKSQHMGETLASFMRHRDQYSYDLNDVNGVSINLTDGYPSRANPHHPVVRSQPLTGSNRSLFERSLQLIYDAAKVRTCNKADAYVYTGFPWPADYWPLAGAGYGECELFQFDNVGGFYLGSTLPSNHPKRAELVIKSSTLSTIMSFLGVFTSQDAFLEDASGIAGLTLHPSSPALHRLLFFGASSTQFPNMPDYDAQNADTNVGRFVSNSIEPVTGIVCPLNGNGVPHCSSMNDVLRLRDANTIFAWERLGFTQYLRPTLQAFAELGCNASVTSCNLDDYTGENYFLDLISTLWKHWPDQDHGGYCSSQVSKTDPRYCSGAGVSHYEPILSEAFETDLVPALHELSVVGRDLSKVTVARGPSTGAEWTGSDVIAKLVRVLFSQTYAASVGMRDRAGGTSATWTDGTPQSQLTAYTLFADALHAMDLQWDRACEGLGGGDLASCQADAAARKSKWKRARSQLVDQFLAIEGEGPSARFKNPAGPKALLAVLRAVREQLNANCPNRENGVACTWAKETLGRKMADVFSRPTFAAVADVTNAVNADDTARREVERFLSFVLLESSGSDALQGLLASGADILQILAADDYFAPIFNAAANAAGPANDLDLAQLFEDVTNAVGLNYGSPAGAGAADRVIQVLKAMSSDDYDRYHVLDWVLPALVTPVADPATPNGLGLTPMEIIMNAVADVNRVDAATDPPLAPEDFRVILDTVRDFFTSETRGFEQLYYIVKNRSRGPEEE